MRKVALLPIALAMAFSSSPSSADTLNPITLTGESSSETCFDGGVCTEEPQIVPFANSFSGTAFGSAQTTANLGVITSVSSNAQASPPPGGSITNPNFSTENDGTVTLHYQFEVLGPQNISIPVSTLATMTISVSGTPTFFDGYGGEAILTITGDGQTLVDREIGGLVDRTQKQNVSVSIDQTNLLVTNLAYDVTMVVGAGADIAFSTSSNMTGLSASASIDPSFQLGPSAPSGYSIVFSDGIGDTPSATPLPATLPLFAGGLGMIGLLTRRKKQKHSAPLAG